MQAYFLQSVFPVLTPLAFDPGRPFPHMSNLSLNIAVVVKDHNGEHFARVKVPDTLPQLVRIAAPVHGPAEIGSAAIQEYVFVWLEQVIMANLKYLFPGLAIVEAHPFHITRDAEVAIQEVESDDLLETVEEAVWQRRFRDVVRLQVHASMPENILKILITNLELDQNDIYRVSGPIDLSRLRHVLSIDRPDLKDKPFVPSTPPGLQAKAEDDIFARIRQSDVLLHHPFESFQPVVELLRKAARDPEVLAIKMTLYRVGRNSPIVEALVEAIENGKQVAVLVELKARFDEESNIEWARQLGKRGRARGLWPGGTEGPRQGRDGGAPRRRDDSPLYPHGHRQLQRRPPPASTPTWAFSPPTSRSASDVTDLFNYLTGYSAKSRYRKLLVAPVTYATRVGGTDRARDRTPEGG